MKKLSKSNDIWYIKDITTIKHLKLNLIFDKSDGWSDRIDVAQDYYEEAEGSLSIKAYSPLIHEFDGYFTGLNPSNNARNVWFNEYWEERFKCYLDESSKQKFPTSCKSKKFFF